jgi:hypothetical protein
VVEELARAEGVAVQRQIPLIQPRASETIELEALQMVMSCAA